MECLCGCGKEVIQKSKYYSSVYVLGHNPVWNKGLTKVDERVKRNGESISKKILESGAFLGRKITWSDKLSKIRSGMMADGSFNIHSHYEHGYYVSSKTDMVEFYQSSLELKYMLKLDSQKDVKVWTRKHKIVVEYVYEGKSHRYVPDFKEEYLDGSIVITETKGWVSDVDLSKFAAAERLCKANGWKFNVVKGE